MLDLKQRLFLWILIDRDTYTRTETATHTDTYTNTRIQSHSHLTNQNHSCADLLLSKQLHQWCTRFESSTAYPGMQSSRRNLQFTLPSLHQQYCCTRKSIVQTDCIFVDVVALWSRLGSPTASRNLDSTTACWRFVIMYSWHFWRYLPCATVCNCTGFVLFPCSYFLNSSCLHSAEGAGTSVQVVLGDAGVLRNKPVLSTYPRQKEASTWHGLYRSAHVLDVSFISTISALDFVYMQWNAAKIVLFKEVFRGQNLLLRMVFHTLSLDSQRNSIILKRECLIFNLSVLAKTFIAGASISTWYTPWNHLVTLYGTQHRLSPRLVQGIEFTPTLWIVEIWKCCRF